jgi:DNA repair exonuclease SbcCD ATPase subunit
LFGSNDVADYLWDKRYDSHPTFLSFPRRRICFGTRSLQTAAFGSTRKKTFGMASPDSYRAATASATATTKKRSLEYTTQTPSPPSSSTSIVAKKICTNDDGAYVEVLDASNRFISQQHLDLVRADLEHERSLREIDAARARLVEDRLSTELEAAKREADKMSALLQTYRENTERIVSDLRASRTDAVSDLQQARVLLSQVQQAESKAAAENRALKKKCERLQEQVEAQAEGETRLRDELDEMREAFEAKLEALQGRASSSAGATADDEGLLHAAVEPAPSALMKELQKTRIKLAEAERQNRQWHHKYDKLEERNLALVRDHEGASLAKGRASVLERKVAELRIRCEEVKAQNSAWTEFGSTLMRELGADAPNVHSGPPEVATVLRHVEAAQSQAKALKGETQRKDQQIEFMSSSLEETTQKLRQASEQIARLEVDKSGLQRTVDDHRTRVQTLEAEKAILEREMTSLRALVRTFDGMPLLSPTPTNQRDVIASPKLQTSFKTLEVRLQSVQDELDLVRRERDRAAQDLDSSRDAKLATEKELANVKGKFAKLREALMDERSKAARAEQRAIEAESLAGKGSFNPEKVRALHLTETPLAQSLREEIGVLKRQLEAKGEGSPPASATKMSTEDWEKKMQRLMENFKGQISLFREGVFLATGFRVELLPGTDRPTFRVRSVFAENEGDELMLKWPKGDEVSSLDILETDLAKVLATTPSYQYMVKFNSLPAFLASVQLSLFEKQTVMF